MKILLIYRIDTGDEKNLGVINKMNGQAKAFRRFGDVDIVTLEGLHILKNQNRIYSFITRNIGKAMFYKRVDKLIRKEYDLVYIRYTLSDRHFLRLIKRMKGKVIIEFPTYPYEKEYRGIMNFIRIQLDKRWRKLLHRYVDHAVHFGPHKSIYRIPTINLTNGIDSDLHPVSDVPFQRDRINMIAVGKWNKWHGLDQLIKGMGEYVKNKETEDIPVYLNVVGEGPELSLYKDLVSDLALNPFVKFHGIKSGRELDEIYWNADVGVGSLGLHRIGLKEASPLKHREYAVRGIVVFQGGEDEEIPDDQSITLSKLNIDMRATVRSFFSRTEQKDKYNFATISRQLLGWESRIDMIIRQL